MFLPVSHDRETLKKEQHYQRFSRCLRHSRLGGPLEVTEEMSAFGYIQSLSETAKRIAESDQALFEEATCRFRGHYYCLTPLGSRLWLQIRAFVPSIDEVYASHAFEPHVTVLLRACRKWRELFLYCRTYDSLDLKVPEVRAALDRIAAFTRRVCRSAHFKRAVSNYRRASAKNLKSCWSYINDLLAINPQLLVVRVDLYFLPQEGNWANVETADAAYEKFLRALRESRIVPNVLGYISARNTGYRRGMHYQVLAISDVRGLTNPRLFASTLGSYWINRCARDSQLGSYFSCYDQKEPERFNRLGWIHGSDRQAITALRTALAAVIQSDHQLKTNNGRDRNLRRGNKPRLTTNQGQGAFFLQPASV